MPNYYRKVYQCTKCSHIQIGSNDGVCKKCGEVSLTETVARWVNTTSLWRTITLSPATGYWEVKAGLSGNDKTHKRD